MSSSPSPTASFDFEQLAAPPQRETPPSLDDAAERAKALIARAEIEADHIRDSARAVGYDEGLAAGRAEAREELQPATAALGEALGGVRELQVRAAETIERRAVELAVEIAEKVVAGALAVEPERVLDVIGGALRATVERERVVVQVNPDDLALVRGAVEDLALSLGGIDQLDVQQERRVPRGGAILRTPVGELDARISVKLDQAREAVEAELGA